MGRHEEEEEEEGEEEEGEEGSEMEGAEQGERGSGTDAARESFYGRRVSTDGLIVKAELKSVVYCFHISTFIKLFYL